MTRAELEAFQDVLAGVLFEERDPAAMRARLLADPSCAPFRAYVESFEPQLLEVTSLLAKRWGSTDEKFAPPVDLDV